MADIVRIVKAHSLTAEIVREMYQALMIDVAAPTSPSPRSVSPTPDDTKFRGQNDQPTGKGDRPAVASDADENVAGVTKFSDRKRSVDEYGERRDRDPAIQWQLEHSACTGHLWIDIDPTEIASEVLEDIFTTREQEVRRKGNAKVQKNFITYYGPDNLRSNLKIRINAKYEPWDLSLIHI